MRIRSKGYLWEILQALQAVQEYTQGSSLADYLAKSGTRVQRHRATSDWRTIQEDLPGLGIELEALLREPDDPPP